MVWNSSKPMGTDGGSNLMEIKLSEEQKTKLLLLTVVENISIEEYVTNIVVDYLNNVESKSIVSHVEELFGESKEKPKRKPRNKKNALLTISKTFHKEYSTLILSRCTIISKGQKEQPLILDINDALMMKEHGQFTYDEFQVMETELNVSKPVLYRFLWNVQEGNFDGLIDEFKEKMDKVFFSVQDKKLYCNSEQVCDLIDAEIIVSAFINNSALKERKIWETIRRYPHIDELHIHILCENYENTDLLRFFNQKKETKVVNNREKRQNMLMNGGI